MRLHSPGSSVSVSGSVRPAADEVPATAPGPAECALERGSTGDGALAWAVTSRRARRCRSPRARQMAIAARTTLATTRATRRMATFSGIGWLVSRVAMTADECWFDDGDRPPAIPPRSPELVARLGPDGTDSEGPGRHFPVPLDTARCGPSGSARDGCGRLHGTLVPPVTAVRRPASR